MKNIMTKISLLNKKVKVAMIATFVLLIYSLPAFAEGTANTDVTTAFTSLKDDVVATLSAVAALGVGVMAIFLAWKYGRKIFSHVAK
ncbi:MAG: hypothetical protein A4E55_00116 [Pelotomaculum sp. PtaU1.Bin035]|nr:MAG: hypothetical protein A4E55_00116 [Pelotomaculum sp. PtaU1.Bin035]